MQSRRVQMILVSLLLVGVVGACSLSPSIPVTGLLETAVSTALQITPPAVTPPPASGTPDRGTPDQAKAMLEAAVAHYNQVGRTQALADFTNRVAPFFDRDLYVACIDSNLLQSANGGYPSLVGSPIQPISRSAWNAASNTEIKSVSYDWLDPATGTTEPKTFYYERVGSDVCGVGAYTP